MCMRVRACVRACVCVCMYAHCRPCRLIPLVHGLNLHWSRLMWYALVCVCVCARACVYACACVYVYVCMHTAAHAA